MSLALDKELTFKTVFRYRHIYPMAIDAVAAGKVNLKGIVTDIPHAISNLTEQRYFYICIILFHCRPPYK